MNNNISINKSYLYSIITHSTAIEGSTLSELDTQLLFDEGVTAKGKPLIHHLMNEDLRKAYLFAFAEAGKKTPVTPAFLRDLNALVMKSTGGINHVAAGTFDSSKGEYRLCGVTAGQGGKSYLSYLKVADRVAGLCEELNRRLTGCKDWKDVYRLSFDAHLNLVGIHPWLDGNGRTSRLLMNYIQFYHHLIPTKIYKEDKADYITSLIESREKEENLPFRTFMLQQHLKSLREEISHHRHHLEEELKLLF